MGIPTLAGVVWVTDMVQDSKLTNGQPKDRAGTGKMGQLPSRFEQVEGGEGRKATMGGQEEIWG